MFVDLHIFIPAMALESFMFFLIGRESVKKSLFAKVRKMIRNSRNYRKAEISRSGAEYIKGVYDKLERYFDEQSPYLDPDLMLKDVAVQIFTNKQYVAKAIKTHRQMNFSQFVNSYRIKYAIRLFESDPSLRVNELAFKCGFNSPASFTISFKMFMNMPPGEWCRNYKLTLERSEL